MIEGHPADVCRVPFVHSLAPLKLCLLAMTRSLPFSPAILIIALLALVFTIPAPAAAQGDPDSPPKYEFRGAWIATVTRLDWPSTSDPAAQRSELIAMLDELKEAGINAVMFQVRTEGDAMYESDLEPWSYWLTGEQGTAPDPLYDPLEFAIEEAHARGMELHAWFNPYRAVRGSGYEQAPNHVTATHPEWLLTFDNIQIFDPGIPEVRDHVSEVILDVVERYDIDGVHFDDYFYPYPPNHISDEDQETFETHGGDFEDIGDWRRNNVNLLIEQIHEGIESTKPQVKFGISPFGIWQNGVPPGIIGLDAYNVIFADAVTWLDEQWLDYLTPQLYWAFGGGQDYGSLAPWWAEHAAANDRHLYPGHGLYRSESATFSGSLFAADEVPRQVRFNREHEDISGSVFFRARNITLYTSKGFADSLETDLYRFPALTPVMDWHDQDAPPPPGMLSFEWTGDEEVTLYWSAPEVSDEEDVEPARYAVYRSRSDATPDPEVLMADAQNLLAVTGDTMLADRPGIADDPYHYVVASVSANSIESEPGNFVSVEGRATSIETPSEMLISFSLEQNYPNPFRDHTEIDFTLEKSASATLRVYDVLGREVVRLVDGERLAPGTYSIEWDGTDMAGTDLPAGTYFGALEVDGSRATRTMVLLR